MDSIASTSIMTGNFSATSSVRAEAIASEDHISQLPEKIILHIFGYLSPRELASNSLVSRRWYRLSPENQSVDIETNEIIETLNDQLIDAANNGHLEEVITLLNQGANIEARDYYGWTPLLFAAWNGHINIVTALLERGADIEARVDQSWIPHAEGETPLLFAAAAGHVVMTTILLDRGAKIERATTASKMTPLMFAASHGHAGVVISLLKRGASIDARSDCNYTPLMYAAGNGNAHVVATLLKRGANINATNDSGYTAIDLAYGEETQQALLNWRATQNRRFAAKIRIKLHNWRNTQSRR